MRRGVRKLGVKIDMKNRIIFSIFPPYLSIQKNGCSFTLRKSHPVLSAENFLSTRKPGFSALRIFSSWTKYLGKRKQEGIANGFKGVFYYYQSAWERENNDLLINKRLQAGYAAVVTVVIIGAVLLAVGLSVTIMAINETQQALGEKNKEVSLGMVESCVDDALVRLNKTNTIPGTITLPTGSCNVTINSQVGNDWTFTVSGSVGGHKKNIQVSATRTSTVTVTSWLEI